MSAAPLDRPASDRATLQRVAAEASVSVSTVSKVLNKRSGVSAATRSRVETLLRDHRYRPRKPGSVAAPLIELVFREIDSAWAIAIIQGVETVARVSGMSVVLTEIGDRQSPGPDWIDGVVRRSPAGVILVLSDLAADHKQQLRTRNIPFVVVDPAGEPAPDVPSIGSANWAGGYAATRHLIGLGHERIAIITGPDDMMCATARLSGFRAAMAASRLPIPPEYVVSGEFHPQDGLRLGAELLSTPVRPSAIFAGSDLQALGLYEAARAHGIRIPDDLSVVGFDDIQIAQWAGPPLTTIRQPLTEMAEEATRLVLRLRSEPQVKNLRLDLATQLVVRASTAAPR